jgi:hypothetical protein
VHNFRIKMIFLALLSYAPSALAITCVKPNDWTPGFCDLPVASSPRCVLGPNNWVAKQACVPATVGCAEIGGCFGVTPVGHWWAVSENGVDRRCQCGCFAEETLFTTSTGQISGRELISLQKSGAGVENLPALSTLDSVDRPSQSVREINGVIFGPESELAYTISVASGRQVTVSARHPVLVVNADGKMLAVKAAAELSANELLLNDDGQADRVTSIQTVKYAGQMINFNVKSDDASSHFVNAGGIILGDNAWQQRLAAVQSRILLRADLVRELERAAK